jgi:hypothetical protein
MTPPGPATAAGIYLSFFRETAVSFNLMIISLSDILKAKEQAKTKDDPKAGADVGKIVNLMAGDANRV